MWLSHFANRPGQLFSGAQNRLTILLGCASSDGNSVLMSTKYHRWDARNGERDSLLPKLQYVSLHLLRHRFEGLFAKIGSPEAVRVLNKIDSDHRLAEGLSKHTNFPIYWVRVPGYFCQFFIQPPMARPERGGAPRIRGEVKMISARNVRLQRVLHAVLNSSAYYLFYCAYTDARHINPSDVYDYPLDVDSLSSETGDELIDLSHRLEKAMRENTTHWRKSGLNRLG